MPAFLSRLSAPIAAAVLAASLGLAHTAAAAPLSGAAQLSGPQAAPALQEKASQPPVVKVHDRDRPHRHGHGHDGRRGGHRGQHFDGHRGGPRGGHGGGHWGGPGWHGHHAHMGPRQIRRSLRHRGFHRIKIVDRRGPMFIVKAIGWRGMPVRLVVDSRNARIVRSHPVGGRGYWQPRW